MKVIRQALVSVIIILVLFIGSILIIDLYFHSKFDQINALNYRGYRGSIVGPKKEKNEIRIGFFGGSVAMGYGVRPSDSMASQLERLLNKRSNQENKPEKFSVLNLAMNGEEELNFFKANYNYFKYLNLDRVIFYVHENLISQKIFQPQFKFSKRMSNWIFRTFNYYFITPDILREKYYKLFYRNIDEGYQKDKMFSLLQRRLLLMPTTGSRTVVEGNLAAFIDQITEKGVMVYFVMNPSRFSQPDIKINNAAVLRELFKGNNKVVVLDLNSIFQKGYPAKYLLDRFHLSKEGNRFLVEVFVKYFFQ